MKRKTIIVVAFLLVLYMVPSFALATEYEASEQSITSFAETLPDDVLFSQDSISTVPRVADSGQDDYEDSFVIDGTTWSTGDEYEYVEFDFVDNVRIESVSYSVYGSGYNGEGYLDLWNSTDWIRLETLVETESVHSWYNDTLNTLANPDYILSGNVIRLGILGEQMWFYATVDYLQVSSEYMTLADSEHYAESFMDVSDWTLTDTEAGESKTSDGDVLSFEVGYDGAGDDMDMLRSDSMDIPDNNYVIELRYSFNVSPTDFRLYCWEGPAYTGDYVIYWFHEFTSMTTIKQYYGQGVDYGTPEGIESFQFLIKTTSAANIKLDADYLRISPSDEMGWQHDGSTTVGVEVVVGYGGTISSDGDYLSLIADADGSQMDINFDVTATTTKINPDYYSFLEIKYHADDLNNKIAIDILLSDGDARLLQSYGNVGSETKRYNIRALSGSDYQYMRMYVYSSQTVRIDYIKIYSIADYSITQSGVTKDDYLYVDSGILYCSGTSFTSIVLVHDPTLDFDTGVVGSIWTMTTSSGTPEIDFYIDGAWLGYTSDTSGTFTNVTLTDLRIRFTDSANIEAIIFFSPIPQWNDAGETTVYFHVSFDYWAFDMLLIFLGLGMIILGSLYGAYKIRNDPDMDTVIVVLLLFMFGCALFLGGIGFVGGG